MAADFDGHSAVFSGKIADKWQKKTYISKHCNFYA